MRIALISDLHACSTQLEAVLDHAADADEVWCLGDVIDLGPSPNRVVQRLRELGIPTLGGNHDPLDEPESVEFLRDIQDWTRDQLTSEHRAWLAKLPPHLACDGLHCVHGSPSGVSDGLIGSTPVPTLCEHLQRVGQPLLAAGHTHVQLDRRTPMGRVINVGSTAQPFRFPLTGLGQSPQMMRWSEYAVVDLTQRTVEFRRVAYDWDTFVDEVHSSGMPHGEHYLSFWCGSST